MPGHPPLPHIRLPGAPYTLKGAFIDQYPE